MPRATKPNHKIALGKSAMQLTGGSTPQPKASSSLAPIVTPDNTNPIPGDLKPGMWVRWYKNGWRHGWIESVQPKSVTVIHLGKRKHFKPEEIEAYDARSDRC